MRLWGCEANQAFPFLALFRCIEGSGRRGRGALTACGTRRESVRGGSVAASVPPHGPATGKDTAPEGWSVVT
ncbi:hypothetical protein XarbCFBP8153_19820 [Xanthomonas arboricola]|nr:hypothetical protein XarbCFBP8153_19820 [Xanthomonas arboricola]